MNLETLPLLPDDETIALRLKALSHPVRVAIVRALARQDHCCCGELVRPLALAQSTVSQHLKVLREAGLISGKAEGVKSCYRIERQAFDELAVILDRIRGDLDSCHGAFSGGAGADACCNDPALLAAADEGSVPAASKQNS
ncbi:MAG: transcriptional regulator [Hyphomicrobiales bacterium]|nr:MAG: transcriptional regulator [Hyphomicrobiales bacterium]